MKHGLIWWQRAGIGALGGVVLAVLKLMDANFLLGTVSSIESAAALLTYLVYTFFGAVAAVFLLDHDPEAAKTGRSPFLLGLVAPSVFLGFINQPIKPTQFFDEGLKNVPRISSWLIPSAHAQEPARSSAEPTPAEHPKIVTLSRAQVEPSFGAAFLSALGRRDLVVPYAYVVGTTTDKEKALEAAQKMNFILLSSKSNVKLTTRVIKPEGASNYYVTVGSLGTAEEISGLKFAARSAALKALTEIPLPENKPVASLLLQGRVVQARSLID